MKYRIGYEYYWNCFDDLKYKDRIVRGANIDVLFSPIFECSIDVDNNQNYPPEQNYEGNYLFKYFTPTFNKEKNKLELEPTYLGLKLKKAISFKIVGYELSVEAQPDNEFKGFLSLERLAISKNEFMQIFKKNYFKDLQTAAYFTEAVK